MNRVYGSVLWLLLFFSMSIAAQGSLSLSIGANEVKASNASKGSKIVFFGDQIEPRTYFASYFHGADVIASSTDGSAIFDLQRPVPRSAVWIAVDSETGDVAMAIPPGSPALEYVPDADSLKHDFSGNIAKLQLPFIIADVLLVRPGDGAWRISVADGGPKDEDHQHNGKTSASIETLAQFEREKKPPNALKRGDVLVIIEPRSLRYAIIKVKQ